MYCTFDYLTVSEYRHHCFVLYHQDIFENFDYYRIAILAVISYYAYLIFHYACHAEGTRFKYFISLASVSIYRGKNSHHIIDTGVNFVRIYIVADISEYLF